MLNTNCQYLRNEIMEVFRAFGKDDGEYTHYFSYSGGKFFNSIEYENEFYDFVDEYDPQDDLDYKRHMKRFAKLAFYKVLSRTTGVELPWGALTGIRPTKLAYSELAAGRDFAELFRKMCVSDENTQFIRRVLEEQKPYVGGGKSLYISVPFCPTKCEYCSFITAPVSKTAQYIESYVNCLTKQIELSAPFLEGVRSIYVGGGSPFVLEISQLERIYAAINAVFKGKCEYTVEAGRPDTFSPEKLALSKKYGVNRICVNPQSFSDKTLRAIGRKHTAADTLVAYALAKEYGFD